MSCTIGLCNAVYLMLFDTKQEIRKEIAKHIRGLTHMTEEERRRELARIERLLSGLPLHFEMLAKHIAASRSSQTLQQNLKRFTLAVSYKLGLLRYLASLQQRNATRYPLKVYKKR